MVPRIVALVVILVVGAGALAYTFLKKPDTAVTTSVTPTTPDTSGATATTTVSGQTPPPTTAPGTSVYKDGTYSATGSYVSPGGNETIGVSLTLANGVVTAVTITPHPVNAEDGNFQNMFASGISPLIVGKNVVDANVKVVSGSSLTSRGFEQAVKKIEAEAKA